MEPESDGDKGGRVENKPNKRQKHDKAQNSQWYVYLKTNFDPTVKTNSFVGVSADPVQELKKSQSKRSKLQSSRHTWRLELVLGPYTDRAEADDTREKWTASSRGIKSRRATGLQLFAEKQKQNNTLRCFDVCKTT